MFASWRIHLSVVAYNSKLVRAEDAPNSFADLLDPKWLGKLVKAHPGYSGTIMTATQQMVATLGWRYFEKLAKQKVMQLQWRPIRRRKGQSASAPFKSTGRTTYPPASG